MRSDTPPAIRLKDYAPPAYRAETVDMVFGLSAEDTLVRTVTRYRRQPGAKAVGKAVGKSADRPVPLHLDGEALKLESIRLDGKPLDGNEFEVGATGLTLKAPPREFELEIVTRINPLANTELSGLYRSGGNYCTQCEAEGFRRITYFQDRPDVLSVYSVRIEADREEAPVLLSNGNPGRSGKLANGRHFAEWHDPHPKPSYLFALVGGRLDCLRGSFTTAEGRAVRLGIFVQPGKKEQARYAMDALKRSMRFDEERFGCLYDLDVFNIVAVPDFNMGAMENKGLNIFNDKYILADAHTANDSDFARIEAIIAHEYFHNWTGNRITCRDWFQLCLKEGLTVYRDQEFTAETRSRPVKRIEDVALLRAHQFPEDAGPLAHPVRPDTYREINNFYTATVYEKGAEIVRMLESLLGRKTFDRGLSLYLKRHDGEAATVEQFIACFSEVSGRDLTQFFLWYTQAGTPNLQVSSNYEPVRQRFTVSLEQSVPPTPGQPRKQAMHIPLRIGLVSQEGEVGFSAVSGAQHDGDLFEITKARQELVFEGVATPPVVSLNRGFTAPVHIRYDQPEKELLFLAARDSDPFNRWQAIRAAGTRRILSAMRAMKGKRRPSDPEEFSAAILALAGDKTLDPAFRAELATLPGENEIAQAIGRNVDPLAIQSARNSLLAALGERLEPHRAGIVRSLGQRRKYSPDAEEAGKRRLAAALLDAGLAAGSEQAEADVLTLFNEAQSMSERETGLRLILRHLQDHPAAAAAIGHFYGLYRDNHIVIDKWFMHQAMAPGMRASDIRELTQHADFNWTNPNRVRALLHSFAAGNPAGFNRPGGDGYRLVGSAVKRLDKSNPQLASRLLTVFRSWRMLEPQRRGAAQAVLEKLSGNANLSRDVRDILDRMLGR